MDPSAPPATRKSRWADTKLWKQQEPIESTSSYDTTTSSEEHHAQISLLNLSARISDKAVERSPLSKAIHTNELQSARHQGLNLSSTRLMEVSSNSLIISQPAIIQRFKIEPVPQNHMDSDAENPPNLQGFCTSGGPLDSYDYGSRQLPTFGDFSDTTSNSKISIGHEMHSDKKTSSSSSRAHTNWFQACSPMKYTQPIGESSQPQAPGHHHNFPTRPHNASFTKDGEQQLSLSFDGPSRSTCGSYAVVLSKDVKPEINKPKKSIVVLNSLDVAKRDEKRVIRRIFPVWRARGNEKLSTTAREVGLIARVSTPIGLKNFRPSHMILERKGLVQRPQGSRYLGNSHSASAALQMDGLSEKENCAIWVTRIHPSVTLVDFLQKVRTGAVFAVLLSEPEENNWGKAAKLVFFKNIHAQNFLNQVRSYAGITFRGVRVSAIWNRHGYLQNETYMSRVLQIRGPKCLMSYKRWTEFFQECVVYELEAFIELNDCDPNKKIFEFRFGRVDGQAESLYHAVLNNDDLNGFEIRFAEDPCEPGMQLPWF